MLEQYRECYDSVIILLTAVAAMQGAALATLPRPPQPGCRACRREKRSDVVCLVEIWGFSKLKS
jgi:hypothetical protein